MNIIELAKQAGMRLDKHNGGFINQSELFRFAALVRAAALKEAAGVADEVGGRDRDCHAYDAAAAIRALKDKT